MADKKRKYLCDEARDGIYVRAWKEGRGRVEYVVRVWWKPKPDGEPEGDWAMPGVFGLEGAIAQAILNTRGDVEAKAAELVKKVLKKS